MMEREKELYERMAFPGTIEYPILLFILSDAPPRDGSAHNL